MQHPLSPVLILAAGDAETIVKIIGGLLFLLFIMAGSLMGGKKKPGRPGEKQRTWEDILREMTDTAQPGTGGDQPRRQDQATGDFTLDPSPAPSAPPLSSPHPQYPPMSAQAPTPARPRSLAKPTQRKRKATQRPLAATAPSVPIRTLLAPPLATAPSPSAVAAPMVISPTSASGQQLRAQALAKLLKPATLRHQILMAEILGPPLSLRPESIGGNP